MNLCLSAFVEGLRREVLAEFDERHWRAGDGWTHRVYPQRQPPTNKGLIGPLRDKHVLFTNQYVEVPLGSGRWDSNSKSWPKICYSSFAWCLLNQPYIIPYQRRLLLFSARKCNCLLMQIATCLVHLFKSLRLPNISDVCGDGVLYLVALLSNKGSESVPTKNSHHFLHLVEVYATLQSLNSLLKEATAKGIRMLWNKHVDLWGFCVMSGWSLLENCSTQEWSLPICCRDVWCTV